MFRYCCSILCVIPVKELLILRILKFGPSSSAWPIRVSAFQPGGPSSIAGGDRNFNFYPGTGCVCFACVLSCVVARGGPDIVLTTHSGRPVLVYLSSVLVLILLLHLQVSHSRAFGL